MKDFDLVVAGWFVVINLLAFLMFGFDKWRARRAGPRVPEATLILLGAMGGWIGGLVAMMLFRHKTAKMSFQIKYGLALIPMVAEVWGFFHWRR